MKRSSAGNIIGNSAALACLLEVSASKPGNVHRNRDFTHTSYEHFLAGGVAIAPSMRRLAEEGYVVKSNGKSWLDCGLGRHIFRAVKETSSWQSGGNVNLGIVLLLAPLSLGSGYLMEDGGVQSEELHRVISVITRSTRSYDVVNVYKAISLAMSQASLGKVGELDVNDEDSIKKIQANNLTLFDVFKVAEGRDGIAKEWVTNFEITFNTGLPYLRSALESLRNINNSIVDTYLQLLSLSPDSLIIRKSGLEAARRVSDRASEILEAGGSSTSRGSALTKVLDDELQGYEGRLNPGTTADIVTACIFLNLVSGWRP